MKEVLPPMLQGAVIYDVEREESGDFASKQVTS